MGTSTDAYGTSTPAALTISNAGNVGIGTTSPSSLLSVSGSSGLMVTNTGAGNTFYVEDIANDTTPFVIDGSGNVGIGTTGPEAKLDVTGALSSLRLSLSKTDVATAPTAISVANSYLHIGGSEYNANSYRLITFGYHAEIQTDLMPPAYIGYQEINIGGATKGDLIFGKRDVIKDTAPSERMRITAGGNVGIGTTSPATTLSVQGNALISGNITSVAGITATSTIPAANFVASSASATSTFAGGLAIETSGLVYDFSTNNVGIGTTSPWGLLSINPNGITGPAFAIGSSTQCVTGDTRLRRRRRRRGKNGEIEYDYDEVEIKDVKAGDEVASLH